MEERTKNPNQEIVTKCCNSCPLLPSKPGNKKFPQHVIAAADSASRLKKLVDGKLAAIVFKDPNDLSAKRVSAYFGLLAAENKSERNRFKDIENNRNRDDNKQRFNKNDYF